MEMTGSRCSKRGEYTGRHPECQTGPPGRLTFMFAKHYIPRTALAGGFLSLCLAIGLLSFCTRSAAEETPATETSTAATPPKVLGSGASVQAQAAYRQGRE